MNKHGFVKSQLLWIAIDITATLAAFVASVQMRSLPVLEPLLGSISSPSSYWWVIAFLLPIAVMVRVLMRPYFHAPNVHKWTPLFFFSLITTLLLIVVLWLTENYVLNRTLVFASCPAIVTCLILVRYLAPLPACDRLVLLIGDDQVSAEAGRAYLRATPNASIIGSVSHGEVPHLINASDWPWLGSIENLEAVLARKAVDEVLVPAYGNQSGALSNILSACETIGVQCRLWLGENSHLEAQVNVGRSGTTTVTFDPKFGRPSALIAKQILDYTGALLLLAITAPLWLVIAAAIKFESRGPVLFRHRRVGLNGRPFDCLKFRSMEADAHSRQEELSGFNEMTGGHLFKMNRDPRVTKVGRLLRLLSLDELPQLLNVMRGEMSLVGPRALSTPLESYSPSYRRRLSVKPGITCLWQTRRRWDVDFSAWMSSDLEYVERRTLLLDLLILVQTAWVVLRQRGAR